MHGLDSFKIIMECAIHSRNKSNFFRVDCLFIVQSVRPRYEPCHQEVSVRH